eukprot:SM000013S26389  [mRNA]  locus=s13:91393:93605:- [translate_table: standard]
MVAAPLTRPPSRGAAAVPYRFGSDAGLREKYRNPWGYVRVGRILEDLDALAGTIAYKHCADDDEATRPPLLVTACVDKISLRKAMALDVDLVLKGAVAWVGRSSMEIRLLVIQPFREDGSHTDEEVLLESNFTFVARDSETGKAVPVNRLAPETYEERALYEAAEARNLRMKQKRAQPLQPPQLVRGAAWPPAFDTVRLRARRWQCLSGHVRLKGHIGGRVCAQAAAEEKVRALVAEGRIMRAMPALADCNQIMSRDTRVEYTLICQPQQRNVHGRIFGGFLLRRAFELAFSTSYLFCGCRPIFLEVDHVDFLHPVDIGDMLRFKSEVLYTENEDRLRPLVHLEVVATVMRPEQRTSQVSNTFYFTFTVEPEDVESGVAVVRRVVPTTEHEARTFLARYEVDHSETL